MLRAFLAAGLLVLATSCATPLVDFDEPTVELVGLRPLPAEGLEARFGLRLRVQNPNTKALPIEGLAYQVYLREKKVLSGVSSQPVTIPAYGEEIVELEAGVGMLGSLALLRDLMAEPPDSGLPYRLETKLSLGGALRALRLNSEGVIAPGR